MPCDPQAEPSIQSYANVEEYYQHYPHGRPQALTTNAAGNVAAGNAQATGSAPPNNANNASQAVVNTPPNNSNNAQQPEAGAAPNDTQTNAHDAAPGIAAAPEAPADNNGVAAA